MNRLEKICSFLAVAFAIALVSSLILIPDLHQPNRLLPLCLAGFTVNIALMFIVIKDIFSRSFNQAGTRFIWLGLVLLMWPSIIFYLFLHGFKPRNAVATASSSL